jgi:hypothetical protein
MAATAVSTASAETKNWRTFIDALTTTPIHGVKIPMDSISAVMDNAVNGIRVYGALKTQGDPTSFHVYVVAIDENGNDIITLNGNSEVYNFSSPCPTMCGNANVLNC